MQMISVKAVALCEHEGDDHQSFIIKSGFKGKLIFVYDDCTGDLSARYQRYEVTEKEILQLLNSE